MSENFKHQLNCTECHFFGEVHLEQPSEAILTECPRCKSTLLLMNGRTELLDLETTQNLQKAGNDIKGQLKTTQKRSAAMFDTEYFHETKSGTKPLHSRTPRDHVISKDEIFDLIIDLETTVDVQDFISRI
jgi:hypothetical protein